MFRNSFARLVFALIFVVLATAEWGVRAQQAIFRSGTERVTVAVVARDRNNRPMTGLSAADFQIVDEGESRAILDFRSDVSPISVALLLDSSGSMRVGPRTERANEVSQLLLAAMKERIDEAALFVFDKSVRTALPFTNEFDRLQSALASVRPYGSTSLYDAIAQTARQLASRPGRRGLVVLTDGVDTSSQLTVAEVSGIASAIDMPVYVVTVGNSMDFPDDAVTPKAEDGNGNLDDLARWSGGTLYRAASLAEAGIAARQIVTDLRHQYLMAFEPGSALGWHRIEVRARQQATLQARNGYWVGPSTIAR
jgi:Ca-activated chloride channel homolog